MVQFLLRNHDSVPKSSPGDIFPGRTNRGPAAIVADQHWPFLFPCCSLSIQGLGHQLIPQTLLMTSPAEQTEIGSAQPWRRVCFQQCRLDQQGGRTAHGVDQRRVAIPPAQRNYRGGEVFF